MNNREEEPNHGRANLEDKLVEVLLEAGKERLEEEDRLEDRQEKCLKLWEFLQQEEYLHLQEGRLVTLDKEMLRRTERQEVWAENGCVAT